MDNAKEAGWIALIAITIFFVNLGGAKLWDRDEPRNAGCAREMLDRGNYVTPIFNNELRDAKPVLLYWLIMSAYQLFGVNEFAARFWSAALAVGTVLCTYFIAQRLFDRRVGILSSVILSTSMMFGVAARAATPDSALIFFGTAALALFVAFAFPRNQPASDKAYLRLPEAFPRSMTMAVGMYGLMAIGVLAKGPIGFLMPTAIIGMYLLVVTLKPEGKTSESGKSVSENNGWFRKFWGMISNWLRPFHPMHFLRTCGGMRLLTATTVILLIAGPWYYLVGVQTDGDFLKSFFLKEHLGRSTTSFENHSGSIFYYPVVLSLGFFPWSVFALPILVSIFRSPEVPRSLLFLFCWVAVQVGLFTIVQTKLPSYVTPCYPALAIICGYFLINWASRSIEIADWIPRISFATLGLGGVAIVIGISYAAVTLIKTGVLIGAIGLLPLIASLIALATWNSSASEKSRMVTVRCLTVSAVVFSISFFGWVLPQVSLQQRYDEILSPIFLAEKKNEEGNDLRPVGSFECLEPSWVFYAGRPIYELVENNSNNQLKNKRLKNWKPKPRPGLKSFLVTEKGQVITREELVPRIEKVVGCPVSIIASSPYFMKDDKLVLIECSNTKRSASIRTAERPIGTSEKKRIER